MTRVAAVVVAAALAIAGAAPASAGGPNLLVRLRFHPEADASWTTCPDSVSFGQVCADTGIFVGVVDTKNNPTTTKEPCIVVQQFLYTFEADGSFQFSDTFGELCGDGVKFRSKDLSFLSGSGTLDLTNCSGVILLSGEPTYTCAPAGTSTVDVTFTGYGPRGHFAGLTDKFQLGDAMCMWVDRTLGREATPSGTITGLEVEPFSTTLQFSEISDGASMAIAIGGECSR